MADTGWHRFYIDAQFFLRNGNRNIQSISIDFGDGQPAWVVNNPFNSGSSRTTGFFASILKYLTGDIKGRITVVENIFSGPITWGSPFVFTVENTKQYAPLTLCKGGGVKWVINAPASRLAPINTQYNNWDVEVKNDDDMPVKDTAYFYFAGNGSSCDTSKLKRPIVFIDGFDPGNKRTVQKIYEEYINKQVQRNGNHVFFGDYLLSQDYDFVILDFKNGNDLIERNAMTLVSLIERLNQTYSSTMLQGITVIGPSMGSLVAQYALAYMEKNNITHNVKTFISFDGAHQGANVPIGLQYFLEYLTKRGILPGSKKIRNGLYNGIAAKQMIAHHASAKSNFPAPDALRTKFLQNLAAVGEYPQLCRKVAIINGTNTGTLNPSHTNHTGSSTLLQIVTQKAGWKSLWGACNNKVCKKFDWKVNRAPSSGNQKVTEMWTADPLFSLLSWSPPGQKNYYADAAWGNSSLDNAPGGRTINFFGNQPGQVIEENVLFWLSEALYLLTGSKRTSFSQNLNAFTMMPSYSAADLRFPSKNLYMRWDNQYLCGKTPFDYVYAPPVNEEHVLVTGTSSQWFENEIRCDVSVLPTHIDPNMTGNISMCTSGSYSITSCKPGVSVVWSASPSGIVSITSSGTSATITRIKTGTIVLTATIASCNNKYTQTVSKTVTVGTPPATITSVTNGSNGVINVYFTLPASASPITSHKWYRDNALDYSSSGSPSSPSILNGGSCGQAHGVRLDVTSACGTSASNSFAYYKPCGTMFSASPNPSSGEVTVDASDGDNTQSAQNETVSSRRSASASAATPRKIYKIIVTDFSGRKLKQFDYKSGVTKTVISISDLPAGMYNIRAFDGWQWQNTKIMKQ